MVFLCYYAQLCIQILIYTHSSISRLKVGCLHLLATNPDWMSARMSDYEGWQLIMSVFTETHLQVCFLLNKALFWNLCAFSNTVPGEHKCASEYPPPPSLPPINGMRSTTEKEILCRERWRIKRNDIEKGWCREERKGWGKGFPWGEKLSVPRRLQTHCIPVISLLPGSLLTAPWLRRLDSFIHAHRFTHTHTYMHFLATVGALTLTDLSTHTTTHSNSIDIRTLTLRMCICDTFALTFIVIITLNTTKVPHLQLCQGDCAVASCCSWTMGWTGARWCRQQWWWWWCW